MWRRGVGKHNESYDGILTFIDKICITGDPNLPQHGQQSIEETTNWLLKKSSKASPEKKLLYTRGSVTWMYISGQLNTANKVYKKPQLSLLKNPLIL